MMLTGSKLSNCCWVTILNGSSLTSCARIVALRWVVAQPPLCIACRMHCYDTAGRAILRYMPELDSTDAKILLALSEDARLSGVEIAQRLDLSRNTVQSRLAKLESGELLRASDHRVD